MKKTSQRTFTTNQVILIVVFVLFVVFTFFSIATQLQLASTEQDVRNKALFLDR